MAQYTSQNIVYSEAFLDTLLTAYKTNPAAALMPTPLVHLYNDNTLTPTPLTTKAQLDAVECAFSNYSAQTPSVSNPVNLSQNTQGLLAPVSFVSTTGGVFVSDTARGYYVTSGSNLVCAEKFATPFSAPFASNGDFLTLNVEIPAQAYQSSAL